MITKEQIIEIIKTVKDPEIDLDLWTLGLIYDILLSENGTKVAIKMTFTSPTCPFGPMILEDLKAKLIKIGVMDSRVN